MFDFDKLRPEDFDPDLNCTLPASGGGEMDALELIRLGYKENPPVCGNYTDTYFSLSEIATELPDRVTLDALLDWEEQHLTAGDSHPDTFRKALLHLDPRAVARLAGLDPIIWAQFHCEPPRITRESWHAQVLSRYDHSAAWMKVASNASKSCTYEKHTTRTAYALYEFMRVIGNTTGCDGYSNELSRFLKDNRKADPSAIGRFQLEGLCIKNGNWFGYNHKYGRVSERVAIGDTFYSFYLDAPAGLVLHYDEKPVAVVAAAVTDPKSLLIHQIQTIHPGRLIAREPEFVTEDLDTNRWELEPFKWREFLFDTLARIASRSGFERIGIQSAANNKWTKPEADGSVHLPESRAARIYDTFATKLHLTRGSDGNYWTEIGEIKI